MLPRHAGHAPFRPHGVSDDFIPLARPAIGAREEELVLEVLRSRQLSLGPRLARVRAGARARVGAPHVSAVVERDRRAPPRPARRRDRGRRRGDHDAVQLRRVGELRPVRERAAGLLRHRPADAQPRPGRRRGGGLATARPASCPSTSSATRPTCRLRAARRRARALDRRGRVRGARRRRMPTACRWARAGIPPSSPSTRTSRWRRARAARWSARAPRTKARIDSERNQGRAPDMGWLDHDRLGFNYRLSDVACALGLAQLERLDELLGARARVAAAVRRAPGGRRRPRAARARTRTATAGRGSSTSSSFRRRSTATRRSSGCAPQASTAKPYLPAIHLMSFYRERFGHSEGEFPVCEDDLAALARAAFLPGADRSAGGACHGRR